MSKQITSFRVISLVAVLGVMLGLAGLTSAQNMLLQRAAQATAAATEINPDQPVVLAIGQAATTPLDKDNLTYRNFAFSGKANDIMTITSKIMSGNFGLETDISSQNDVALSSSNGNFLQQSVLTVKLPQDGNYKVVIHIQDPGAGDSAPGTVSVLLTSGLPPAATAAAH